MTSPSPTHTACTEAITINVIGEPKGQPRPRAFARRMGNKFVARVYNASTAEGWKSCIAEAARSAVPALPLAGPVRVDAEFVFPRPKSHYRTGKRANELRPDAPSDHTARPDRDNLDKAGLDTLMMLGFFVDDAQACRGEIVKRYANPGERPGAVIVIQRIVAADGGGKGLDT